MFCEGAEKAARTKIECTGLEPVEWHSWKPSHRDPSPRTAPPAFTYNTIKSDDGGAKNNWTRCLSFRFFSLPDVKGFLCTDSPALAPLISSSSLSHGPPLVPLCFRSFAFGPRPKNTGPTRHGRELPSERPSEYSTRGEHGVSHIVAKRELIFHRERERSRDTVITGISYLLPPPFFLFSMLLFSEFVRRWGRDRAKSPVGYRHDDDISGDARIALNESLG